MLENAWDTLQDTEVDRKTREDAEQDRKKLLAGELLVEGADLPSDEENELDHIGEDGNGRRTFVMNKSKLKSNEKIKLYRDPNALPMHEEEAELLRKMGFTIVLDAETETEIIGGNMPNPFRKKGCENENEDDKEKEQTNRRKSSKFNITFRTNFDVVELDAAGFIVDKGDEDFTPSKKWQGRKAGFEFKLGLRGLGYYRTGAQVKIPQ